MKMLEGTCDLGFARVRRQMVYGLSYMVMEEWNMEGFQKMGRKMH